MKSGAVPYYRVNQKNKRAYWCPSKAMQAMGFEVKVLGFDGDKARAAADQWTARWRAAQQERRGVLGVRTKLKAEAGKAKRDDTQYVYFLRVGDRIKIGTSRNPIPRVQGIIGFAIRHSAAVDRARQPSGRAEATRAIQTASLARRMVRGLSPTANGHHAMCCRRRRGARR
jgi:hypothetical protein